MDESWGGFLENRFQISNKKGFGSRCSWSFLEPKTWWMKLLNVFTKTQCVDIKSQFCDYGITLFDICVRFDDDGYCLSNGIIEYGKGELVKDLKFLNDNFCTVRINFDNSFGYHQYNEDFARFCSELEEKFPNIRFFGGYSDKEGSKIYSFRKIDDIEIDEEVKPVLPWVYAKLTNRKNIINSKSKTLFIDFVNIK